MHGGGEVEYKKNRWYHFYLLYPIHYSTPYSQGNRMIPQCLFIQGTIQTNSCCVRERFPSCDLFHRISAPDISITFGLVFPYPPLWEKASDVYRQIMEAGYNNAIMSFLEIKCLTRRHSIRTVQHVPTLRKGNVRITPFVYGRMLITFSQHFADLIDLETRLLGT